MGSDIQYDEIQRLRRLVDDRPDWHLTNWGRWRRGYYGPSGYSSRSAGFTGGGYSKDFEEIGDESDAHSAEVCDAVIEELCVQHKIAIQHVYEAAVWSFNRLRMEDVLVAAANEFWLRAARRGLT